MSGRQRRTAEASEDKASILTLIRQSIRTLPPTARRIASYIDEHAQDVIRMSITELAEQAEASEGSVVGLCRRLGIDGFQELKILLSRDVVDPVRLIQEDLHESTRFPTWPSMSSRPTSLRCNRPANFWSRSL